LSKDHSRQTSFSRSATTLSGKVEDLGLRGEGEFQVKIGRFFNPIEQHMLDTYLGK